MALTNQQRADIRYYCGWSARFGQFNSALEMAMNALDTLPEDAAQIINPSDGTPPGVLAQLRQIDTELTAARRRYKADEVGSIQLNRAEATQLRRDGRQLVMRLRSVLGIKDIPGQADVFGASGTGGGFVGK